MPQITIGTVLVVLGFVSLFSHPTFVAKALYWLAWGGFMTNAALRLAAALIPAPRQPNASPASNENLPTYSVIIALYRETDIVPQVLAAMLRLDYPTERLEILFALEEDDYETIDAFHAQHLPSHVRIVEVPEGTPRTKPRALNHALEQAQGERIVIYDAEDLPHPGQLREAAQRFSTGPAHLACLQAPLRPQGGDSFIARQFAAEYAVQFDVILPALHAAGLPFPLGGTSNHFKTDVLKAIGAWDAYNVTEDADLGLRLAQHGYRSGLLVAPTIETPPQASRTWIPQRTRWIKGYAQTLLVHSRGIAAFRPRMWLGLIAGVGMSFMSAVAYAPLTALLLMSVLMITLQQIGSAQLAPVPLPLRDIALYVFGTTASLVTLWRGARRAGLRLRTGDVLGAPVYWCLQSLGAAFAVYQLMMRPFHWDKTDHAPVQAAAAAPLRRAHKGLYEAGAYAYGERDDPVRQPSHLAHTGVA